MKNRWETLTNPKTGKPRIKNGQKAGAACDHWNRVGEDIELMKNIGANSYRFSLVRPFSIHFSRYNVIHVNSQGWSKLEPSPGKFDAAAIKHYHDEIDALLAAGGPGISANLMMY